MLATSEDPQPALDLVEEGVERPEGGEGIWKREDTVEMVDALRDMAGGVVMRKMGKERQRGGIFYMMREWTWHISNPVQGPRSLLWQNTLSIRSGKSGKPEICSVR